MVAHKLHRFTIALCGQRLMLGMWYTHNRPGMLVRLLSQDPNVAQACLRKLSLLWKYL